MSMEKTEYFGACQFAKAFLDRVNKGLDLDPFSPPYPPGESDLRPPN
jgi:hypothetical protein